MSAREICEEIVSDVFIRVWQNRRHVDEIRNFRVYLYVSAKNNTLRYLHSRQKAAPIGLDQLEVELQNNLQDPEEIMITTEMMNKIEKAIDALPPKCKMVYKLVREDRLKYKEIAQVLDITVKTIDNQLAIALKKIAGSIQFNLRTASSSLPPTRD